MIGPRGNWEKLNREENEDLFCIKTEIRLLELL